MVAVVLVLVIVTARWHLSLFCYHDKGRVLIGFVQFVFEGTRALGGFRRLPYVLAKA